MKGKAAAKPQAPPVALHNIPYGIISCPVEGCVCHKHAPAVLDVDADKYPDRKVALFKNVAHAVSHLLSKHPEYPVKDWVATMKTGQGQRSYGIVKANLITFSTTMFEIILWPSTIDACQFLLELNSRAFLIVCLSCLKGKDMSGRPESLAKFLIGEEDGHAGTGLFAFTTPKEFSAHRTGFGTTKRTNHNNPSAAEGTFGALVATWEVEQRALLAAELQQAVAAAKEAKKPPPDKLASELFEAKIQERLMVFVKQQPPIQLYIGKADSTLRKSIAAALNVDMRQFKPSATTECCAPLAAHVGAADAGDQPTSAAGSGAEGDDRGARQRLFTPSTKQRMQNALAPVGEGGTGQATSTAALDDEDKVDQQGCSQPPQQQEPQHPHQDMCELPPGSAPVLGAAEVEEVNSPAAITGEQAGQPTQRAVMPPSRAKNLLLSRMMMCEGHVKRITCDSPAPYAVFGELQCVSPDLDDENTIHALKRPAVTQMVQALQSRMSEELEDRLADMLMSGDPDLGKYLETLGEADKEHKRQLLRIRMKDLLDSASATMGLHIDASKTELEKRSLFCQSLEGSVAAKLEARLHGGSQFLAAVADINLYHQASGGVGQLIGTDTKVKTTAAQHLKPVIAAAERRAVLDTAELGVVWDKLLHDVRGKGEHMPKKATTKQTVTFGPTSTWQPPPETAQQQQPEQEQQQQDQQQQLQEQQQLHEQQLQEQQQLHEQQQQQQQLHKQQQLQDLRQQPQQPHPAPVAVPSPSPSAHAAHAGTSASPSGGQAPPPPSGTCRVSVGLGMAQPSKPAGNPTYPTQPPPPPPPPGPPRVSSAVEARAPQTPLPQPAAISDNKQLPLLPQLSGLPSTSQAAGTASYLPATTPRQVTRGALATPPSTGAPLLAPSPPPSSPSCQITGATTGDPGPCPTQPARPREPNKVDEEPARFLHLDSIKGSCHNTSQVLKLLRKGLSACCPAHMTEGYRAMKTSAAERSVKVPAQTGLDCGLYASANISYVVEKYSQLFKDGNQPTKQVPASEVCMPLLRDGKAGMDAETATKLRHQMLLDFAEYAEELACNQSRERQGAIKLTMHVTCHCPDQHDPCIQRHQFRSVQALKEWCAAVTTNSAAKHPLPDAADDNPAPRKKAAGPSGVAGGSKAAGDGN